MNNKEFISELSQRSGYTIADTQKLVDAAIECMAEAFDEGDGVSLNSFGTFEVKKRNERVIVNPATGQRQLVPPKLVLGFKPIASIKDKLKNGGNNNE